MQKGGECKDLTNRATNGCPIIGSFCVINMNAGANILMPADQVFINQDPNNHWFELGWASTPGTSLSSSEMVSMSWESKERTDFTVYSKEDKTYGGLIAPEAKMTKFTTVESLMGEVGIIEMS